MLRACLMFVLLLVAVVLLVFALPALAQEATPDPGAIDEVVEPVIVSEAGDLEDAFHALIELLVNVTFLPFAATFVVAVTAIVKPLLPNIGAGTIALTVQVVVWVVFVVARQAGVDPAQIESAVQALTTILGAIGGFVGASLVSAAAYNAAKKHDVPLLGSPRRA